VGAVSLLYTNTHTHTHTRDSLYECGLYTFLSLGLSPLRYQLSPCPPTVRDSLVCGVKSGGHITASCMKNIGGNIARKSCKEVPRRLHGRRWCGKVENGGIDFRLHCCITLRRSHMRSFLGNAITSHPCQQEFYSYILMRILAAAMVDMPSRIILLIDNSHSASLFFLYGPPTSFYRIPWRRDRPTPHSVVL
jgi:hypothetical protein